MTSTYDNYFGGGYSDASYVQQQQQQQYQQPYQQPYQQQQQQQYEMAQLNNNAPASASASASAVPNSYVAATNYNQDYPAYNNYQGGIGDGGSGGSSNNNYNYDYQQQQYVAAPVIEPTTTTTTIPSPQQINRMAAVPPPVQVDRNASEDDPNRLKTTPNSALAEMSKLTSSRKNVSNLKLAIRNLSYTVEMPKKKGETQVKTKVILNNISLSFKPGRLTVLMGASGAGKTSLMSALSGDLTSGTVYGSILLNGKRASPSNLKDISAYVFQDDVIMGTASVKEAITMSAKLRLPASIPLQEKLQKVDEIINVLHLKSCENGLIGNTMVKGISGGERKRCSVAMELVTDPPLLFLDEPTTGLDSFTALSLVMTLKNLAREGHTVIATMHQPSSEIFHLFDDLVILGKGEVLYAGEAEEAVDYFAGIGYSCPRYTNPADYFFGSVINDESGAVSAEARTAELVTAWKTRSGALSPAVETEKVALGEEFVHEEAHTGFFYQYGQLVSRSMKNQLRNKMLVRARGMQAIVMAIIVGLAYMRLKFDQRSIQDRMGFLFFVCANSVMSAAMGVVATFHAERSVFIREYRAGMYSLPAYFGAKVSTEFPSQVIFPFIFITIMYWMIGLQNDVGKYFTAYIIAYFLTSSGNAVGTLCSSMFSDSNQALQVLPLFMMPLMLFSGFMINDDTIPKYFIWIKYLSPMKYGFVALVKNEFFGLNLDCGGAPMCPYAHGDQVVTVLGFNDELTIVENVVILGCLFVGFNLLAMIALWKVGSKRSHASYVDSELPDSLKLQQTQHNQQLVQAAMVSSPIRPQQQQQ